MKTAVALINVPDDADIDELCITFDLERMLNQDGDVETIWDGISEPLRPLPEKKEIDKTLEFGGYESVIQEALARGYNAYYDEITGETE